MGRWQNCNARPIDIFFVELLVLRSQMLQCSFTASQEQNWSRSSVVNRSACCCESDFATSDVSPHKHTTRHFPDQKKYLKLKQTNRHSVPWKVPSPWPGWPQDSLPAGDEWQRWLLVLRQASSPAALGREERCEGRLLVGVHSHRSHLHWSLVINITCKNNLS